jgi:hypothetical protein
MRKAKSKAIVMAADGAGGIERVQDRRFEQGDWPVRFEVSKEQADLWLRYFNDECFGRGWTSNSIGQMEASENSASITVRMGGGGQALAVVWERKRDRAMQVRVRSAGTPEVSITEIAQLFDHVNDRCRSRNTVRIYGRGQLAYEGLPWRGEIWLDDTVRLGPPSRQDESALIGPRVVLVDVLVECVGRTDFPDTLGTRIHELAAFLSVVIGVAVQVPEIRRVWSWTFPDAATDCQVRQLGYVEQNNPSQMPVRGMCGAIPLKKSAVPIFP